MVWIALRPRVILNFNIMLCQHLFLASYICILQYPMNLHPSPTCHLSLPIPSALRYPELLAGRVAAASAGQLCRFGLLLQRRGCAEQDQRNNLSPPHINVNKDCVSTREPRSPNLSLDKTSHEAKR